MDETYWEDSGELVTSLGYIKSVFNPLASGGNGITFNRLRSFVHSQLIATLQRVWVVAYCYWARFPYLYTKQDPSLPTGLTLWHLRISVPLMVPSRAQLGTCNLGLERFQEYLKLWYTVRKKLDGPPATGSQTPGLHNPRQNALGRSSDLPTVWSSFMMRTRGLLG